MVQATTLNHRVPTKSGGAVAALTLRALALASARADEAADRRIETSAAASYNFRTVLQGEVVARAEDGIVTLTGAVLDREQRALAEETVRRLPGVRAVRNEVAIASAETERADGWIALTLRTVLLVRKNLSARYTTVTVQDGVVTLAGTAETEEQKRLTEAYARSIEGVKDVHNELRVRAAVASGAPAVHETIDDASIAVQVKRALRTDATAADLTHTSVESREGVVTLRGATDSQATRDRASEIAASVRGVISVDNQLTVSVSE